ncbi:MAG: ADP-ribosylglycohydrolase family protein [Methanoregula sp.]|jgi:ADP-ribosyl-[dinitrogen reductase] hydrolase|nr:ADP-ribosylglycohydrolase family protein [Methanoregula sp.]
MPSTLERFQGSLVGLATGDAMGVPNEFLSQGTFPPVKNFMGGGPSGLKPGEWTDDTSMALCLAESLIECRAFSLTDQLKRYDDWFRHGYLSSNGECFDSGITIQSALEQFERSGTPDCGQTSLMSAGNGSLMRLAPVPLAFHMNPSLAIRLSGESSTATHALPICVDACRYYGALIIGAIQGVSRDALLSPMFSPSGHTWDDAPLVDEICGVANGSFRTKQPPEICGNGYVLTSLEAALWAFAHTDSFEDGCLAAVNLGDDADTVGAIYGQLAGAYYGINGIPAEWRHSLVMSAKITGMAEELFRLSGSVSGIYTSAM